MPQVHLSLPGEVELSLDPSTLASHSVAAGGSNRAYGFSVRSREDAQSAPDKRLARQSEAPGKRQRIVQGNTPGIHRLMHVDRSDRPEILPASVNPAHSDGKVPVVDLACPRKAIFHHWHAAALSDSGLARCREEIRRGILANWIVVPQLAQGGAGVRLDPLGSCPVTARTRSRAVGVTG